MQITIYAPGADRPEFSGTLQDAIARYELSHDAARMMQRDLSRCGRHQIIGDRRIVRLAP